MKLDCARLPAAAPLRAICAALAARPDLPPLTPAQPYSMELRGQLLALDPRTMLGVEPVRLEEAAALLSGLLLGNDCLEDSHLRSQQLATATGSYWHGLMHRREPDFANAEYWFRKAGRHPVHEELREEVGELLELSNEPFAAEWRQRLQRGGWDAAHMVRLCEQHPQARLLREVQACELQLLGHHCLRRALGG